MRFQDLLNEVLDKPVKWKWTHKGKDGMSASFRIKKREFDVDFTDFTDLKSEPHWELDFFDTTDSHGSDITGKGDELKVFATVKDILLDWLKKNKNNKSFKKLMFTAKEPSRIRLYKRFADELVKKTYLKSYEIVKSFNDTGFLFSR